MATPEQEEPKPEEQNEQLQESQTEEKVEKYINPELFNDDQEESLKMERLAIEAKDDSKEAILNIIQDALLGTIDSKNSTTIKYLGSENKLESDSDSSVSDTDKLKLNTAFKWLVGYGEKSSLGL